MKKIVFAIVVTFMFIECYYCEASTFFNEFNVINGIMNMEYDKYNNEYTVYIEDDENHLVFDYELEDSEASIVISGNDYLVHDNNVVTITVYASNDSNSRVYTFYVNKYSEDVVSDVDNDATSLEVVKDSFYIESLIAMISFILLLFLFYFIFLRKNS